MPDTLFFLSLAAGLAMCFECGCRSDQRGRCERSGGHFIAAPAGAICRDVVEARWAYKMLSRIRNRPLSLSLVSALTPN